MKRNKRYASLATIILVFALMLGINFDFALTNKSYAFKIINPNMITIISQNTHACYITDLTVDNISLPSVIFYIDGKPLKQEQARLDDQTRKTVYGCIFGHEIGSGIHNMRTVFATENDLDQIIHSRLVILP